VIVGARSLAHITAVLQQMVQIFAQENASLASESKAKPVFGRKPRASPLYVFGCFLTFKSLSPLFRSGKLLFASMTINLPVLRRNGVVPVLQRTVGQIVLVDRHTSKMFAGLTPKT
jgi:hypothetical protein